MAAIANKPTMLMEVWKDGRAYAGTNDPKCVYPTQTILQMIAAGYTVYKKGKRVVLR